MGTATYKVKVRRLEDGEWEEYSLQDALNQGIYDPGDEIPGFNPVTLGLDGELTIVSAGRASLSASIEVAPGLRLSYGDQEDDD